MINSKIKNVSFDSLNEVSNYLFRHQNEKTYNEIQSKVAMFFSENGERKFIEVYNEIYQTKNYIKALDTFKI
jgi:LytS/YehU family sensor histidine kinase